MAIWTSYSERTSQDNTHKFDEYMVVIKGRVTLYVSEKKHILNAGDEIYIPKGTPIKTECIAGTRTILAFEKKRAERQKSS